MISRGRQMARLVMLVGLTFAASPGSVTRPARISATPSIPSLTRLDALRPPEVRLRKLHLVRPDLIPYPIAYEVVC